MSSELLLLVLFLVVIPFAEYLIRLLRAARTAQPRRQTPPPRTQRPAVPGRRPRTPAQTVPLGTPQLPASVTASPELAVDPAATGVQPQAPGRPPVTLEGTSLEEIRPEIGAVAAARSPRKPRSLQQPLERTPGLAATSSEELRRAVVLATILGPCRAVDDADNFSAIRRS